MDIRSSETVFCLRFQTTPDPRDSTSCAVTTRPLLSVSITQ
ncbi:hypothetical protein NEISICOT_00251 [Neisseria sicca ATCC 29256]|uniref:Uncharacterized protein n=1 Tax=Neisseria sicca ATCC 29256 TaxID=547045 RepID=C6M172_NEISI|nr:hypothetical protein NEISICOT_00251 [Neisseria sicca ATCC 29256]